MPANGYDSTEAIVLTSSQSEEAFPLLVVPDFDLVVITSRNKDRLGWVETDTSYGT